MKAATKTGLLVIATAMTAVLPSCTSSKRLATVKEENRPAELELTKDAQQAGGAVVSGRQHARDTIKVVDIEGKEMVLMKTVVDETGEMVATQELEAAVITARFRNIAERNGKIDIKFQIRIPESFQYSPWQLRYQPTAMIQEDTLVLDKLLITGNHYGFYRHRDQQTYDEFYSRIIRDTTLLIDYPAMRRFLRRYAPYTYLDRGDSLALNADSIQNELKKTEPRFVRHYTRWIKKWANDDRIRRQPKMYEKYVDFVPNVKLDTIIRDEKGDYVYCYTQTFKAKPDIHKIDIVLDGTIYAYKSDTIHVMPRSPKLSFYVSTLSSFADTTDKYKIIVVQRRAEASEKYKIDFPVNKYDLDPEYMQNAEELARVKKRTVTLLENKEFNLDSVVLVANASPEGPLKKNAILSANRGVSISKYLDNFMMAKVDSINHAANMKYRDEQTAFSVDEEGKIIVNEQAEKPVSVPQIKPIRYISRSVPENWEGLDRMISSDNYFTEKDRKQYAQCRKIKDPDIRENAMKSYPWYRYVKEKIYPELRAVDFNFIMSRKNMIKDTIHTTVLDTAYMNAIQDIKRCEYEKALEVLLPYRDYNTAVAYLSLDRNYSALEILQGYEKTAPVNYLLAILYSRIGEDQKAVQYYMDACRQEKSYIHRGNLDPEISMLISRYGISFEKDDEDFLLP